MTEGVTLHLAANLRNRLVAKVLAVCFIGAIIAVFFNRSELADYQKGQALTLAQYTAQFEVFRAHLMEHRWPLAGDVALWIVVLALFVGVYELLTFGIALAIDRLLRQGRKPPVGQVAA